MPRTTPGHVVLAAGDIADKHEASTQTATLLRRDDPPRCSLAELVKSYNTLAESLPRRGSDISDVLRR